MAEPKKELTEAQKKAIAFLKRPKPSLDDWLQEERRKQDEATAAEALKNPQPGQLMPDGTVFAGMTADNKQIFAMPTDLGITKTFNDAVKRVQELNAQNAYGHNDWEIPKLDVLHILRANQCKGALTNTFKKESGSSSDCPHWYWSSTEDQSGTDRMYSMRLEDGYEGWNRKDNYRLSCRPVRLVVPEV